MRQTNAQTSLSPFRLIALIAALGLSLSLSMAFAAPAKASSPAEQFVQTNVEKGLGILNDKKLSEAQKKAQFRDFLLSLASLNRTARFTLGAAVRTATPQQVEAFTAAFRNYAIAVYQTRLAAYSGQRLKVTGSTERAAGDYVVTTQLIDPNASSDKQPIQVDFRVDKTNGGFKVIDVSVVGVWLAIEERDQFTAFLANHNNSVPALTKHLSELTAKIQAGGPPTNDQASAQ